MRLIGLVAAGTLAAGFSCCCGDPSALLDKLTGGGGGDDAPSADATAGDVVTPETLPTPVEAPVEEIEIGIPPKAEVQTPPPGVFMRYQAPISVERARDYHNGWLREHGWRVQVDMTNANGHVLEAVKGDHRLTVEIAPKDDGSVIVVFKLL